MLKWFAAVSSLAMVCASGGASADPTSEILFQHKHWEVEVVGFDDGTFACLSEVDATTDSFSLWLYPDNSIKLQFYSTSWEFGEGETADLQVQIGNRSPWDLTGAELYKNSILFNLPDTDVGVKFLIEIAQGNRLFLRTANAEPVMDYSLAGSRAAMDALIECGDAIRTADKNPFN